MNKKNLKRWILLFLIPPLLGAGFYLKRWLEGRSQSARKSADASLTPSVSRDGLGPPGAVIPSWVPHTPSPEEISKQAAHLREERRQRELERERHRVYRDRERDAADEAERRKGQEEDAEEAALRESRE